MVTSLAPGTTASSTGTTSVERDTTSTGDSAGAGGSGSTTLVLDVGNGADVGDLQPVGCKGKIDFLFVISRAGQMGIPYKDYGTIHERLVAAIPDFFSAIESKFANFDYHILVTKGDTHWGGMDCNAECPGPFTEQCGVDDYPCEMLDKLSPCDETWGAGVVFNAGWLAPNKPCDVAGGKRFIAKGQPNFLETFACLAQVGASGYYLVPEALAAAVSPELTGSGGCNEGFLRDDALLVVTFVTNMLYDVDSDGTPASWAQAVLDAKGGDPNSIVMFYIGPPSLEWCDAQKNNRACDFIEYFPFRAVGYALDPSYGPAFDAATDLAIEACSKFIPR